MSEASSIIEIEAVSKAYGYMPVLKKLSLTVQRGQFVALLGPNGSGKSTLLKMISGLVKATGGTITVGGWSMPQEAQAVRPQIGMVSHKALLYDNLTARENLLFFAKLYNVNQSAPIDELLEKVGLRKRADSLVGTFSRGMQQRLSIARALLHNPHVLLFDEPYTGLDQDAGAVLDNLLIDAHQAGHTIMMATHQLERAARLADRIVIISRGEVGYDDTRRLSSAEIGTLYTETTGAASAR
ncbi:MAG: heme ABC exporter ATP-binding protein CcmA [Chloroflexota bacterium]